MPHASLSQTSHVAIAVRAALARLGHSNSYNSNTTDDDVGDSWDDEEERRRTRTRKEDDCWQVHIGLWGSAGRELVPVVSSTKSAPLVPIHAENKNGNDDSNGGSNTTATTKNNDHPVNDERGNPTPTMNWSQFPLVSDTTHVCRWDSEDGTSSVPTTTINTNTRSVASNSYSSSSSPSSLLHLPLRWRDLPRDAYCELTVTGYRGPDSAPLYAPATLAFFDTYGKLKSGMQKIPLFQPNDSKNTQRRRHKEDNNNNNDNNNNIKNPGLDAHPVSMSSKQKFPGSVSSSSSWQQYDDDPVWKASKILEQLDRFDDTQQYNTNNNTSTTSSNTNRSDNSQQQQPQKRRDVSPSLASSSPSRKKHQYHHRDNNNNGTNFGDVQSVPWLDQLAREYCERTLTAAKEKSQHLVVDPDDYYEKTDDDNDNDTDETPAIPSAYLIVEIPYFDIPIVHEETFYPIQQKGVSGSVTGLDLSLYYQQQHLKKEKKEKQEQEQLKQKQQAVNSSACATTAAGTGTRRLVLVAPPPFHPLAAIPFLDYENEHENPIDDKYRTLAHDLLRGLVDPALKPDRYQRDKLATIIASPSHHPSREEKDLLWRFRFSLVDNSRALTKFLLAVDWTVESEVVQAAELLEQWRKRSPIQVTDALKLLGKQVAYQTNLVRAYAIDTLESAPDEELNLYLLQLVQALKYEHSIQQQTVLQETGGGNHPSTGATTTKRKTSSLATFLIMRASRNVLLANYLYWYLKVELQDPAYGAKYHEIFDELKRTLTRTPYPESLQYPSTSSSLSLSQSSIVSNKSEVSNSSSTTRSSVNKLVESVSKLGDKLLGGTDILGAASVLSSSSSRNESETSTIAAGEQTKTVSSNKKNFRTVWDVLRDQDQFISGIMDAQMSYFSKPKQAAKEVHLRAVLGQEGYGPNSNRLSFPLPCAPEIMVNGVSPEKAKVFRSAVYPALIEFNVEHVVDRNCFGQQPSSKEGGIVSHGVDRTSPSNLGSRSITEKKQVLIPPQIKSYRVLMKTGDDLRQDQLVMMMIKLMDRLLKRASLDLCITPYSIIATSPSSGIVEFVEQSAPLSAILANHNNSILQFFHSCAPQKGAKYGVRPDVISSYVRSVAGT